MSAGGAASEVGQRKKKPLSSSLSFASHTMKAAASVHRFRSSSLRSGQTPPQHSAAWKLRRRAAAAASVAASTVTADAGVAAATDAAAAAGSVDVSGANAGCLPGMLIVTGERLEDVYAAALPYRRTPDFYGGVDEVSTTSTATVGGGGGRRGGSAKGGDSVVAASDSTQNAPNAGVVSDFLGRCDKHHLNHNDHQHHSNYYYGSALVATTPGLRCGGSARVAMSTNSDGLSSSSDYGGSGELVSMCGGGSGGSSTEHYTIGDFSQRRCGLYASSTATAGICGGAARNNGRSTLYATLRRGRKKLAPAAALAAGAMATADLRQFEHAVLLRPPPPPPSATAAAAAAAAAAAKKAAKATAVTAPTARPVSLPEAEDQDHLERNAASPASRHRTPALISTADNNKSNKNHHHHHNNNKGGGSGSSASLPRCFVVSPANDHITMTIVSPNQGGAGGVGGDAGGLPPPPTPKAAAAAPAVALPLPVGAVPTLASAAAAAAAAVDSRRSSTSSTILSSATGSSGLPESPAEEADTGLSCGPPLSSLMLPPPLPPPPALTHCCCCCGGGSGCHGGNCGYPISIGRSSNSTCGSGGGSVYASVGRHRSRAARLVGAQVGGYLNPDRFIAGGGGVGDGCGSGGGSWRARRSQLTRPVLPWPLPLPSDATAIAAPSDRAASLPVTPLSEIAGDVTNDANQVQAKRENETPVTDEAGSRRQHTLSLTSFAPAAAAPSEHPPQQLQLQPRTLGSDSDISQLSAQSSAAQLSPSIHLFIDESLQPAVQRHHHCLLEGFQQSVGSSVSPAGVIPASSSNSTAPPLPSSVASATSAAAAAAATTAAAAATITAETTAASPSVATPQSDQARQQSALLLPPAHMVGSLEDLHQALSSPVASSEDAGDTGSVRSFASCSSSNATNSTYSNPAALAAPAAAVAPGGGGGPPATRRPRELVYLRPAMLGSGPLQPSPTNSNHNNNNNSSGSHCAHANNHVNGGSCCCCCCSSSSCNSIGSLGNCTPQHSLRALASGSLRRRHPAAAAAAAGVVGLGRRGGLRAAGLYRSAEELRSAACVASGATSGGGSAPGSTVGSASSLTGAVAAVVAAAAASFGALGVVSCGESGGCGCGGGSGGACCLWYREHCALAAAGNPVECSGGGGGGGGNATSTATVPATSAVGLRNRSTCTTMEPLWESDDSHVNLRGRPTAAATAGLPLKPQQPSQQQLVKWYDVRKVKHKSCPALQAHMVAAFEQSLSNMTSRLQHLTATAEQKDSELIELRKTIEALQQQSAEAGLTKAALQSMQAVQRTLHGGTTTNGSAGGAGGSSASEKERLAQQLSSASAGGKASMPGRQPSSDSMSSLASAVTGSHQPHRDSGSESASVTGGGSVGVGGDRLNSKESRDGSASNAVAASMEAGHVVGGTTMDKKPKKKKGSGWLRSSFGKAFSRGSGGSGKGEDGSGGSSGGDSSVPNSPQVSRSSCPALQTPAPIQEMVGEDGAEIDDDDSGQQLGLAPTSSTPSSSSGGVLGGASPAVDQELLVDELRKQLRDKDMVLTDIRLEALSSAHQLDQLKELVGKLRAEIAQLRAENERLSRLAAAPGGSGGGSGGGVGSGNIHALSGSGSSAASSGSAMPCAGATGIPGAAGIGGVVGNGASVSVGGQNSQNSSQCSIPSLLLKAQSLESIEKRLSSSDQSGSPTVDMYLLGDSLSAPSAATDAMTAVACGTASAAAGVTGNLRDSKRIPLSVYLDISGDLAHIRASVDAVNGRVNEVFIGCVAVGSKTSWPLLDAIVRKAFKEYVLKIDPASNLGLSAESVLCYHIGRDVVRLQHGSGSSTTSAAAAGSVSTGGSGSTEHNNQQPQQQQQQYTPELLPCGYLVGDDMQIKLVVRGTKQGGALDALAFQTLVPKSILTRYVALLNEHRRVILCGPSGTGKTFLAQKLAEFLVATSAAAASSTTDVAACDGRSTVTASATSVEDAIATFNVDRSGSASSQAELKGFISHLAERSASAPAEGPHVVIIDNLHYVSNSLSDIFNGLLLANASNNGGGNSSISGSANCPFIIGTMNQARCGSAPSLLQLSHNFRWVLCATHLEPVKGLLARCLRRRIVDHEARTGLRRNPELQHVIEWMPLVWQHVNTFLETHNSADATIGPRLFLSCPLDVLSAQVWFTDLWNFTLVPYMIEATREGLQMAGRGSTGVEGSAASSSSWEDPLDWIKQTYPFEQQRLACHELASVRYEDVMSPNALNGSIGGKEFNSYRKNSASILSSRDSDPLLNMLMRLQEAASYSPQASLNGNAGDCS